MQFQSTRPVWGATRGAPYQRCRRARFQSTRPVWGATHLCRHPHPRCGHFNPRAPCGARRANPRSYRPRSPISIHAPRVGRDAVDVISDDVYHGFQSTRPVWGATRASNSCEPAPAIDFNPRAPCGARRIQDQVPIVFRNFNPRAPCGARPAFTFNSTEAINFNPRAPCGARLSLPCLSYPRAGFQSTRPVWGATAVSKLCDYAEQISIHAPRVGRDATRPLHAG